MKNKYTKATGLLALAILSGQSNADTIVKSLLPVSVTVALSSKSPAPQLTAINEEGKPDKTLPKVASTEVTTQPNSKGQVTTTWTTGVKAAATKVDNAAMIAAAIGLESTLSAKDRAAAIKGWSLLAEISRGAGAEGEEGEGAAEGGLVYNVYASKAEEENIPLFSVTLPDPHTASFVYSETLDEEGTVVGSKKPTGSASYEGQAGALLGDSGGFSGLFTVSTKVEAWNPDTTNKYLFEVIDLPAAAKIASIVGSDASGASLTGTISFGAPKVKTETIKDEAPAEE